MRFNTLLKLSSILTFAGLAYGSGYRMTFYGVNGNRPSDSAIPACGTDVDYNTDYYVALNEKEYHASQTKSNNANTATVCNKCVKISYQGKWVVGRIVDSCPGCPSHGLDVSPAIFEVFADRDEGVIYMDWEFADCSLLGKSSKSGGGSSSHQSVAKKTTIKKTTSRRTTTTTTTTRRTTTIAKKTTTTTKLIKPTVAKTTKVVASTLPAKSISSSRTLPSNANIPKMGGIINATKNTGNNATATKQVPVNTAGVAGAAAKPTNNNTSDSKPAEKVVEQSISENTENKDGDSTYVLPITGALAVTGAAGVALMYVKRDSKNVSALKEKFPEAFTNIKRSISRGSTVVKRNLSQSGKALKRSLSKKGDTTGPQFRTKKDYRDSLNAHYPLQPVQLYDPPVPSANNVPQYNLQHFNAYEDDNNDLRIDFHDSKH